MFYCPYANHNNESYRIATSDSHYRLLHASPDSPSVDVYINDKLLARNLKYSNFTNYFKAPPGLYNVKVFPAGKTDKTIIDTNLQLAPGSISTIAVVPVGTVGQVGSVGDGSLLPILEPLQGPTPSYSMIRFSHLSPNTPAVDITLPDGKKLFKDVNFKETTGYIQLPPGNYTLQARPSGTNNIALLVPNINLLPNKIYTVYAVGKLNASPPLQVLIPLDGSTYIR